MSYLTSGELVEEASVGVLTPAAECATDGETTYSDAIQAVGFAYLADEVRVSSSGVEKAIREAAEEIAGAIVLAARILEGGE